jgi:hypothetical protein
MPAFSADVLSDKDAADIYAFLQSLPGRQPVKRLSAFEPVSKGARDSVSTRASETNVVN